MDNAFNEAVRECTMPTVNALLSALMIRKSLPRDRADFLTYLAGFTHYNESVSILSEVGLEIRPDVPLLYDRRNRTIHLKIFLMDLSQEVESLSLSFLSRKYGSKQFSNRIWWRDVDGEFVTNVNRNQARTYTEYLKYMTRLTPGICEEVISYSKPAEAPRGTRRVYHFAWAPYRNTHENLRRLFRHVSAVIAVNYPDDMYNLSVKHLKEEIDIFPLIKAARWYVVDTNSTSTITDFLDNKSAQYNLVPYHGEEADYESQVVAELESLIRNYEM